MESKKPNNSSASPSERHENNRTGSWWSHAAYGFGVAALFVPFMIPDLPARVLITVYFATVTLGTIVFLAWGVACELKMAWQARRRRRRVRTGVHSGL